MSVGTLVIVYAVGWLSGICSVLFYDMIQHLKGK